MQIRKLFPYFSQGVVIGMAAGLLVVILVTTFVIQPRPVVEVREVPRSEQAATPLPGPVSYAGAVEIAAPAVVNIHTTKTISRSSSPLFEDPAFRRFFEEFMIPPRQRQQTNLGSGVIVSEQGYVLTNNHVIEGSDEIQITLHDGRTARATIVGTDPESDLAVLKIPMNDLQAITLGDSDGLLVGDVVLAIGNPFGVGQTVTQGIVSATGRSQLGISTFENFIQTDAAINPGNSGGALINPHGELIGVNTAIFSRSGGSQGIGFAIPTSLVKHVMTQIIEHGEAIRGWLGIEIQTLTPELAESFGLPEISGIVIAGVLADGPAARAGLQPGDIVTVIEGEAVPDARAALDLIVKVMPGETIALQGLRDGRPIGIEVTASKRPQPGHAGRR
jgi:serine protease DegS